MKYYVSSYYNYLPDASGNITDCVSIGVATEEDIERDGENWFGRYDGFDFTIYDSLEDAIKKCNFLADKITFEDLSEEDAAAAQRIVKALMKSKEYLKKFGR